MSKHRLVAIPFPAAPKGTCQWCGKPIVYGRQSVRRWHDGREPDARVREAVTSFGTAAERALLVREPECFQAYNLASNHDAVRAQAKNDGWYFCAVCGRQGPSAAGQWAMVVYDGYDGGKPRVWQSDRETLRARLIGLVNRYDDGWWHVGQLRRMLDDLILYGRTDRIYDRRDEHRPLEVDHIVPLVDADDAGLGPLERFALSNLQLLCRAHHAEKTAREARDRANRRRAAAGKRPIGARPDPHPSLF